MLNREYYAPEYIFTDINFTHFLIQYAGDIISEYKGIKDLYITLINKEYAILSYKISIENYLDSYEKVKEVIKKAGKSTDNIIYFSQAELYTLQNRRPDGNVEATTNIRQVVRSRILNLSGQGVIVGIIDTGIDYLSEEFMDSEGKSRIAVLWDQGLESKEEVRYVPYGTVYQKKDIDKAIEVKKAGGNPYDIVNSKDSIGNGTTMAGIVGGSGKNKDVEGVAPRCEFAVVKLVEAIAYKSIMDINVPVYNSTAIFTALEFLSKYGRVVKKPIVILLSVGTSMGAHDGNSLIDSYIKGLLDTSGIALVCGTGNEGIEGGHSSGIINSVNGVEEVNLKIDEEEKILIFQIWIKIPNIMTMSLISPSGQETGYVPIKSNSSLINEFTLDGASTLITNSLPEEFTGNQLIRVIIKDTKKGTWKIRMKLLRGEDARFDIWLPQGGIKKKGTVFIPSDSYGTLTIPGDIESVITVGAYNQNNRNILDYSGRGFKDEYKNIVNLVSAGKDILTVGPNNETVVVNGTNVSAAIVAAISALIFEWAIVRKNHDKIYAPALITMLERGTDKRKGDIYPNAQWGYGIVDLYKIFEELI